MLPIVKRCLLQYIPGIKQGRDLRNLILANKTRALLRTLQPYKTNQFPLVRLGNQGDGGYVMLDNVKNVDAAYSLGIGDNASWDKDIADFGAPVYMYDHTIDQLPFHHKNFHFFKIGVCGKSQSSAMKNLETLISLNGHKKKDLILKCDIERDEYAVIDALPEQLLPCFSQIVCEFHYLHHLLFNFFSHRLIDRCFKKILKYMYCVHLHANNYGEFFKSYGTFLPNVLEITFARKDLVPDFEMTDKLATHLDYKNNIKMPDIDISALWKQELAHCDR